MYIIMEQGFTYTHINIIAVISVLHKVVSNESRNTQRVLFMDRYCFCTEIYIYIGNYLEHYLSIIVDLYNYYLCFQTSIVDIQT